MSGLRWTKALFSDGSQMIVEDDSSIPAAARSAELKAHVEKLTSSDWRGWTIFIKIGFSYFDDEEVERRKEKEESGYVDPPDVALTAGRSDCGLRPAIVRPKKGHILRVQKKLDNASMLDSCEHPCLQESEQFDELLLNFERQAEEM